MNMKSELESMPGIGKSLAKNLNSLGIKSVKDLRGRKAEDLYGKLCKIQGKNVDRCVLYAFRCAVYYSSCKRHNPDKLKWWNWKDANRNAQLLFPDGRSRAKRSVYL